MKYWLMFAVLCLVLSNVVWATKYRELWYESAQAEGLLDEATHYINTACWNNER